MFEALVDSLGAFVTLTPSPDTQGKSQRFATNGMGLSFEIGSLDPEAGLFEVATPECEGPEALFLRLRGYDAMLVEALPGAEARLAAQGFHGRLGLVKGSRDVDGSFYGRQLNIEVTVGRGARLWLVKALSWVMILVNPLFMVAWFIGLLVLAIPLALLAMALAVARRSTDAGLIVFTWPLITFHSLYVWVMARLAFRDVLGPIEGFLVSRAVVTGTGHLDAHGRFWLSGKGEALTSWRKDWLTVDPRKRKRGVFAADSFVKPLIRSMGAPGSYWNNAVELVRDRQRLQLADADSNRAEVAEALSVTMLDRVVALAERGDLDDAPRFADPLHAHRTIGSDSTLAAIVTDQSGREWTGLGLQRFYQRRAAEAWPDDPLVALWGEALDGLASDRTAWVGRIDWVTKAWLLEQCANGASQAVRKRVDLEYHELGTGLYDRLVEALDLPPLADPAEVRLARIAAPSGPAEVRASLLREHGAALAEIGWGHVRVGDKVIWLHG